MRSTSKGGRSKSPTSAEFRAAIKEKNKMEMEIEEYQKTLDEMSAAMANLHQEDYGSTIRIQELERRCEIASKQSGHLARPAKDSKSKTLRAGVRLQNNDP